MNDLVQTKVATKVGIIGPPESGKTVFLGALASGLTDAGWKLEVRALPVEPKNDPRRPGQDQKTTGCVLNEIRRCLGRGFFPPKTPLLPQSAGFLMAISKDELALELSLLDPAGELFVPAAEDDNQQACEHLNRHLKDCAGILILMDPRRSATESHEAFRQALEQFTAY